MQIFSSKLDYIKPPRGIRICLALLIHIREYPQNRLKKNWGGLFVPHLLLFSRSVVSDSLWPHGLQHSRLPCPSPSPGFCSNSRPLSRWCHPTISSSVALFSPPALNFSQHQGLFQQVDSLHQVAKVLEFQHQFFQWIFRVISFRIDWFDILAVQGTIKSLTYWSPLYSIHLIGGKNWIKPGRSHMLWQIMLRGRASLLIRGQDDWDQLVVPGNSVLKRLLTC